MSVRNTSHDGGQPSEQVVSTGAAAIQGAGPTAPASGNAAVITVTTPDEPSPSAGTQNPERVAAEEPEGKSQQPRDELGRFTSKDIEKARAEERDKLYPTLQKEREKRLSLEERLASLEQFLREQREAEEAAKRAEEEAAEAARRQRERDELDSKELIRRVEEELEQKFQARIRELEEANERERAIREKEQQLMALNDYRTRRLQEEQENIAPQFVDFVRGDTQEEIEQAIALAKDKTREILEEFETLSQNRLQNQVGTRVTGAPAVGGPLEMTETTRQLSPADIKNMSMAEYAKYRDQLLSQASQVGLYD